MDVDGNGSSSDIGYDIEMEEAYSQNENRTKKAAGKNKKEKILHQDYWKDFGDPFDQLNHSIKG